MKNILISLILLCCTPMASATKLAIMVGDPLENLLATAGDASIVEGFEYRETAFTRFYYQELNHSFIINNEMDNICDIAVGITGGNCFPCEENQTSALCP